MRSSHTTDRTACVLTIGADCLVYLDQTLNELRKRARHRSTAAIATGAELMALRSGAVEAAGAYVDGVRKRRRQGDDVRGERAWRASESARRSAARELAARVDARGDLPVEAVVCTLSPALLADLDELLRETLYGDAGILRGYSGVVPPGRATRGWLGAVRFLATRRRR